MKHFGFLPRLLVVTGLLVGLGAPITSALTNTAEAAPQVAPHAQDGWWPGQDMASGGGSSGAGGPPRFAPNGPDETVSSNAFLFLPGPGVAQSLGKLPVQAAGGQTWWIEDVTLSPRFVSGDGGRILGRTVWSDGTSNSVRIEGRSVAEFQAAAQAAATKAQQLRDALRAAAPWLP